MAAVSLKDVRKSYTAELQVIHGVNMEIADGEFIVILGPSGCGKSTLLRMVAGLEKITGGEVTIGDRVVNNLEPKDRDIAMVFQNYALYPHMSVYDNMAYGLRIKGLAKYEIDKRVQKAAVILELGVWVQAGAYVLSERSVQDLRIRRVAAIDGLLDGTARIRRGGGGAVCICGAPILLGARFCASCGRSLAPGSAESRQAGSDAPG